MLANDFQDFPIIRVLRECVTNLVTRVDQSVTDQSVT